MKRRQALLAGGSCISVLLSGCVGGTSESTVGTPVYDCDDVARPVSPSPNSDPPGEAGRYTYPDRPDSLSNESTVRTYVKSYERAYRLSALHEDYESSLDHAGVSVSNMWTHEAPEGAMIVRLKYRYRYGYEEGGSPIEADSPTIYASYYIDDAVMLRAVHEGNQEDESGLDPDPVKQGQPVECF
ncbi:hypothetical protein ACFR9U_04860 [Halorientalis brevis]|uniref:Lipoprotein n=1 Tax=Halorientalis brevis TaxID=1126241 RepID=A0ABD6C9X3_9EURY|nr:hypothetical protein [Halorientalis brevis]